MAKKQVAIVVGSISNWKTAEHCVETLRAFGVEAEIKVMSARRTPHEVCEFAENAAKNGIKVIIGAAGGAAHLCDVLTEHTTLPVIEIPMQAQALDEMDSLLSTVQIPEGIPVATVPIGKAGALNAAILAVQMLALSDAALKRKLVAYNKEHGQRHFGNKRRAVKAAQWLRPMRYRPILCCIVALLLSLQEGAVASDWGSSHNLLIKAGLSDQLFLISRSNMASRRDGKDYFLGYAGVGLGYQFHPNWSLRAGYRHAWFKIADEWSPETRPYAEAYYSDTFDGFHLTSRSRVEFRYFEHRDDDVRLRQEFTLTAPWEFTPLNLKLYLEEEIFFSADNEWIEANWAGCGLSFFPRDGVKFKMGYRMNDVRVGGDFVKRHVWVTGLSFFF